MSESEIIIRECLSVEDFQQCIELERAIWQDDDVDIMPIRLYMILKACKAPTIGAFDSDGRLVGFVHTALALIGKNIVYHSHLAGVIEDLRHKDIGYRLKLAQRQYAIEAGIPMIFWTFDPLQSRNAHFNINKLGAIVRRYEVNYYGEGASTIFDSGVPSDRIFAEWWITSPHVQSVLAGNRPKFDGEDRVTIPDDINRVRAQSIEDHLRYRLSARDGFQSQMAGGQIVRGFARDNDKGEGYYIFGPDEEQFSFKAYSGIVTAG